MSEPEIKIDQTEEVRCAGLQYESVVGVGANQVQQEKDVRDRPLYMTKDTPWNNVWGAERIMTRAEAFELVERAKDKTPGDWLSWKHLGTALHITGDSERGLQCAMNAVRLHRSATTLLDLSVILETFGRYNEGLRAARMANEMDPKNQFAGLLFAQAELRQGRWASAWPLFEKYCWGRLWEVGLGQYIQHWQGEPLAGKRILIVQGGGFGDNLMFFRWFANLKAQGAHVTYACPGVMVPLLQGHPWIDEILATHEDESTDNLPEVDLSIGRLKNKSDSAAPDVNEYASLNFDYFCPIMALARRCLATPENTEAFSKFYGPYIEASQIYGRCFQNDKPMVGICWAGAEKLDPRRHRSLNEDQIKKLLAAGLNSVNWVNLQFGMEAPGEAWNPDIKNWADTARVIKGLDLVITVDTGVMHLAGAMGKPTWVMLPGLSDWKFLLGRDDSPFYSSLKLFRNRGEGLHNALDDVIVALAELP